MYNCLQDVCVSVGYGVIHTGGIVRVQSPYKGPLKWVLRYYLEVILYNCV